MARLEAHLRTVDGKGYKAYASLAGVYDLGTFTLFVDHVQADPFAPPSLLRVRVDQRRARFPAELFSTPVRRTALEDAITRGFAAAIRRFTRGHRGTGGSGRVEVDVGGQEVVPRTSGAVTGEYAEVRFAVGLPAAGRICLGREAHAILLEEVPQVVAASLAASAYPPGSLARHVAVVEDQEALRSALAERRLVAFVADGALLPRESGVSDRPLREGAIPFASPPELRCELGAPHRGPVTGMGIPQGVTLLVGGGYHGKSTLLAALARGVYNHIPGDGREYVVTRADAVKVRAEDGRRVEQVDISPFIRNLPLGQDTAAFSTDNASGSTSQAANIVEALEAGASLLLMDEDTCATNFMVRDARMQRLIPKEREPITPFVDQVRNLSQEHGVSTIIVMGGSSDYFEVADTVLALERYEPRVVTAEAQRLTQAYPSQRRNESGGGFGPVRERIPLPDSIDPYRRGRVRVSAQGVRAIRFGEETIDLSAIEQLVDPSQARAIGELLVYGVRRGYWDGRATLRDGLGRLFRDVDGQGLDILGLAPGQHPGDYARPRPQEVAAALNRLCSLRVRQAGL
ncbi:MAG: ABC-ATPase domain-containing protein [Chloroflexi bacterium]|nr:ABC-ATPase domain-containing protein [Chloroflexota bacterium]